MEFGVVCGEKGEEHLAGRILVVVSPNVNAIK